MNTSQHWLSRIGSQRDWVWRGWQTRYTYVRAEHTTQLTTPIILLHGFGASIGHWRHNLTVLGQSHSVYALDMLGFGASRKVQTQYNVDLWVEQVYDFWRTFIQQPVVLVGNSIGSLVCMAAAAAHPEMVKGIVMMSLPDPSLEAEAIPSWLLPIVSAVKGVVASPWLLSPLFYQLRRPPLLRKWASIAYANSAAVTDELVEILAGPAQDRGSAQAFCALFRAVSGVGFGPSVKAVLPTLNLPMLLIWGRQDQMVPFKVMRQFSDLNPKLQMVELDNAGHCPHDECPDEVNQLILDWLDTIVQNPVGTETSLSPVSQQS